MSLFLIDHDISNLTFKSGTVETSPILSRFTHNNNPYTDISIDKHLLSYNKFLNHELIILSCPLTVVQIVRIRLL